MTTANSKFYREKKLRVRSRLTASADANTSQHAVNYMLSLHSSQYVFAFTGQQQENIQCKVNLIWQPRHERPLQFSIATDWLTDITRQTQCLTGTLCTHKHLPAYHTSTIWLRNSKKNFRRLYCSFRSTANVHTHTHTVVNNTSSDTAICSTPM